MCTYRVGKGTNIKKLLKTTLLALLAISIVTPVQFASALQVSNGRIAYNEYDSVSAVSSIRIMQNNGTGNALRVDAGSLNYDDLFPVWSPDGTSLLYTHFAYDSGDPNYGESIWFAPVGGGAPTKIAQDVNDGAKWSPDSTYAYYEKNGTQVYRIHADGSGTAVKVLDSATSIGTFDISPDGSKILYTTTDSVYVETIASQVSSRIVGPLTDSVHIAYWSPDGTKIMYKTVATNTDVTLYVANSDGASSHAVTPSSPYVSLASDSGAMWSPDSSKLLYTFGSTSASCQAVSQLAHNVYVANATSGADTALTTSTDAQNSSASWSPDGTRVLYAGTPCASPTNTHIYTMATNGTGVADLTPTEAGDALYPVWETVLAPSQVTQGSTTTMTVAPSENMNGQSVTVPTNAILDNNGKTGDVVVQTGGTIMGSGTTGDVVVATGGTIAPGNSPGCLNTNDLTLSTGATYQFQVGGTTACSQYDQINVTGAVSITGSVLAVSFVNGFTGQAGNSYTIITNDGADAVTGTFAGLAEGATFTTGGATFKVSYVGGDGNDVTLTQQSQPTLANTGSSVFGTGILAVALVCAAALLTRYLRKPHSYKMR